MYFPREEYEQRWKRVQTAMKERGHEALVVWQRSGGGFDRAGDVYWLTNYASMSSGQEPTRKGLSVGRAFAACLFHRDSAPEVFIAEGVAQTDLTRLACGRVVEGEPDLPTAIARHLVALGVKDRVAYVGEDLLPIALYQMLCEAAPALKWVPDESLIADIQRIKSPRELEAYRIAGDIATGALNAVMEALVDGRPESEAAARGAAVVLRAGGGFQRISMNHGPHSDKYMWSDPMYSFTTEAPKAGDMLRGWVYGPIFQGYWLDPGRSAVCGRKPTPGQRALIEGVNAMVQAVIAAVRPGVTPRQAAMAVEPIARRAGYFDHPQSAAPWKIVGHGVGTFFRPPILVFPESANFVDPGGACEIDTPFEAGMVASSEAFLSLPGVGTAACEQNYIVTDKGVELLTRTPLEFW